MRERDYENLLYSAANLNRPVQKCATCKLDHGPVPVDPIEVEETKKIQLIEQKKKAIRDQLILNVEKSKKR